MRTIQWVLVVTAAMVLMSTPLVAGQDAAPAAAKPAAALVNLNTATAAQLETLPGIGPKTAALIIEYRQKNGGFKKAEDLMNVKGVGEKSFLKIRSLVTVTPTKTERTESQPASGTDSR